MEFVIISLYFLKIKIVSQKEISFSSLKNYSVVAYKDTLKKVKFSHYENFTNINKAYSIFIQKFTFFIDKIATCQTKRIKGNSKQCFDNVGSDNINNRDKLFKKTKKTRLSLDQESYKKACYEVKAQN